MEINVVYLFMISEYPFDLNITIIMVWNFDEVES